MSKEYSKETIGRMRAEASRLADETGIAREEWLEAVDALEQGTDTAKQLKELQEENVKLQQQLKRLRALHFPKDTGTMSSRLRDALRE